MGVALADVENVIEPLVQGRYRLLTRVSTAAGECLQGNVELANSKPPRRLVIPASRQVVTKTDESNTNSTIQTNRRFQIDAAVVRIMKSHKRLSHAELIAEVCVLHIRANFIY